MPQRDTTSKQSERLRGIVGFGRASTQQREFVRAEKLFREALKEKPSDSYILARLSNCISGQHRYDEAVEIARQAIAANPNFPMAHTALVHPLMETGCYSEALKAAQEVIRLTPNHPSGYIAAGVVLYYLERPSEMLKMADGGLARAGAIPQAIALCLQIRGKALAKLHRDAEAIATIGRFMELSPAELSSHLAAGWIYWLLGERFNSEAMKFARSALAMRPISAECQLLMGLVLQRHNDVLGAKQHIEEALHIDPNYRRAREALKDLGETSHLADSDSPTQ